MVAEARAGLERMGPFRCLMQQTAGGVMAQTDTSNRFVLGLLAALGVVLAIVGWYRFLA